jgi:hypothetical protein
MIFRLEILAQDRFSMCLSSVSSGDFRIKKSQYPTITTASLFKTNPVITEGIYLSALLHTNRQTTVCTAVDRCATGTEFDKQFQPQAFCHQSVACHVTCPTHPPLSYHPNNIWRWTPSHNASLYILYLHCETTFRPYLSPSTITYFM